MAALRQISVKHTVNGNEDAVASLSGLPVEMTPDEIRQLAHALLVVADDCEALHAQTRYFGPERRQYPVGA